MSQTVNCFIYKTIKREEMYLYVPKKDAFDDVPEAVMRQFPAPELVMELTLSAERKLGREDVQVVMSNLLEQGFHLQMPPSQAEVIASYPTREALRGAREKEAEAKEADAKQHQS